jgi:hypothetical protein
LEATSSGEKQLSSIALSLEKAGPVPERAVKVSEMP